MFQGTRQFVVVLSVVATVVCFVPVSAGENDQRIEKLEQEVQALKEALDAATTGGADATGLGEIERRIEILANELESLRIGKAAVRAEESVYGLGPAASKVYRGQQGVSIGGYGEMLYRNFDSTLEDGTPNSSTDELDFLRAIVYFGYKFNDRFVFNSEIEFEHASTGESGSVSVEFAYIDYLAREALNVRAGLLLLPMGLVNELHEPTVFLGATRPVTETRIIPSTWRESGAGIFGDVGPFAYRTYVVNGLDASDFGASGLRGGRQKGSKAKAEDFAWTGRLDYVGKPGLVAGVSGYFGDSGQDLSDLAGSIGVSTTIIEGHVDWRWKGLDLRALHARAELDDVTRLNNALALTGSDSIGEEMTGTYIQAGYDVLTRRKGNGQLTPFVRWESVATQDEVPAGFAIDPATDMQIVTLGIDYKPIPQVVIKLDFQDTSNDANTGFKQVNVGMGYVF
ncbi:MAG: hypothetical protein GTN89_07035 [Acidobacteria bacterium]|nr:hypothetical protein [Acidobacteriota bacterium]NIM62776.1 hypothetical protein [Acidobacteriota bacterium]NIO59076.1 hypothetical protein [Acidobacteriota bacterium]NIQ30115.1 hypothetical protein [Acidobacteriota bacterium]NIQ84918.1 hypothetical protein [Acidobacteriota bacterium]